MRIDPQHIVITTNGRRQTASDKTDGPTHKICFSPHKQTSHPTFATSTLPGRLAGTDFWPALKISNLFMLQMAKIS